MVKDNKNIKLLLSFFAVILVIMFFRSKNFFTFANINDIILNSALYIVMALGMLMVLLIGEIDVSIGSMLGVCSMVAGFMMQAGIPIAVSLLAAILTGGILGLIDGILVVKFGITSIIATLATMSIYRGLLVALTGGLWITPRMFPVGLQELGSARIAGIVPLAALIALLLAALMSVILKKTVFGRSFYAVGSNLSSARLSGISIDKTRIAAFVGCGLMTGITSCIYLARFANVQSNSGKGYEMTIVAAAVVGGASTLGAKGNALGTVLGAILISTISTLLIFFGVDSFWTDVFQGLIILAAILMYSYEIRKKKTLNTAEDATGGESK